MTDERKFPGIDAIETEYKGAMFRSRLEARWAIFFDYIGLKWNYETQVFAVNTMRKKYLPDFYLSGLLYFNLPKLSAQQYSSMWCEIKPSKKLSSHDKEKLRNFVNNNTNSLLLIMGDPWHDADIWLITKVKFRTGRETLRFLKMRFAQFSRRDKRVIGLFCPKEFKKTTFYDHDDSNLDYLYVVTVKNCPKLYSFIEKSITETDDLIKAYTMARSTRFEIIYSKQGQN